MHYLLRHCRNIGKTVRNKNMLDDMKINKGEFYIFKFMTVRSFSLFVMSLPTHLEALGLISESVRVSPMKNYSKVLRTMCQCSLSSFFLCDLYHKALHFVGTGQGRPTNCVSVPICSPQ